MYLEKLRLMMCLTISALWLTDIAAAATRHVPAQFPTIGAAIAAAHNGDRILVADGVYSGPGNRNLDFGGKHIRLESVDGPENCIIDCEGQGRAFWFHNGEAPAAKLQGFTIQNGFASNHGGAVLCESSSPTIKDCVFRWNTIVPVLYEGGGAIAALDGSDLRLTDCVFDDNVAVDIPLTGGGAVEIVNGSRCRFVRCTFSGNTANAGGAVVAALGGTGHFRDCAFTGNVGTAGGGGLNAAFGGEFVLEDCQFVGNTGGVGGGMLCSQDGIARLERCRFIGNAATYSGGGVHIDFGSQITVHECEFAGNAATIGPGGGGALALFDGASAVVDGSVMSGNSGSGDGGAIVVGSGSDLTLTGSTVAHNEAVFGFGHAFGGAICAWSSHLTVRHSVFHGNIAGQGTAFGLVEGIDGFSNDLELTVSSSLVQDGECGVFIQAPDPSFVVNWGDENFEADPMYDENLHLLPGSPCIDAGDPAYVPQADEIDIDGDPRVLDGDGDGVAVIDIGADEFTPQ